MEAQATLRSGYSLQEYVRDLDRIFAQGLALPALLRSIADCKRRLLMTDGVLSEAQMARRPDRPYTRNLLYKDPQGRYVIVAILWGPCCTSPVHDHRTWGVMGVYQNLVRIVNFERLDDGQRPDHARLEEKEGLLAPRGSVGYVLPPFEEVHRMENPTRELTLGIHTYGKAVEECTVFDLETGQTRRLPLTFDHDLSAAL